MPTIKQQLGIICSCGGRIDEYYVSGGLAKICDRCLQVTRNAPLPNSEFKMPFGKHKDSSITSLPIDYVQWGALNLKKSIQKRFIKELEARKGPELIKDILPRVFK